SFCTLLAFHCFLLNAHDTTAVYTPSLHDALPIFPYATDLMEVTLPTVARARRPPGSPDDRTAHRAARARGRAVPGRTATAERRRSEEHTSELQSRENLVCRLLLEKKKAVAHCIHH